MKLKHIISLLILSIAMQLNAQDAERRSGILNANEQSIGFASGIDYSIMPIQLAYKKGVKALNYKYPLMVGAELTIPAFNFDLNDVRFRLITETTVLKKGGLEVRAGIDPVFVNGKLKTGRLSSIGADFHIFTGFTKSKWNLGFEVNYNQMFTTYIKHSDVYKENVFSDVVDGWYKNAAANIRIGILINRTLGRFDVHMKTGASLTAQFNDYLFVPPLYFSMGMSYRLK